MPDDDYIDLGIVSDRGELAQSAFLKMQSSIPGWQPSPGNPDTLIIEGVSMIASDTANIAAIVPKAIFRYFGLNLLGFAPIDALPAIGTTTWTMKDANGYTIRAGTTVGLRNANGELKTYQVRADVVVVAGTSSTALGEVEIEATESGSSSNGLTGTVELVDPLDFVTGIALVATPTGGVEAETPSEYETRLSTELRLLSRRPVLPRDFETMAIQQPYVERALAIDGYDAVAQTYNNARTVTIAVTDAVGLPVTNKAAVQAVLQANREVNFLVYVIDASYTEIDVIVDVHPIAGMNAAGVIADVRAALLTGLSPANYGQTPSSNSNTWNNNTKVRYQDLVHIIRSVYGVQYINSITFGVHGGAMGTTDVTMSGPAPLPKPNTITVTSS